MAFARDGGPVLGICNGFQILCEAGLLPGALLPNVGLRFICRQVGVVVERDRHGLHRGLRARPDPVDPRQAHDRAVLRAGRGGSRGGGAGRAALRPRRQPERVDERHRRRLQRGPQRRRADAPPRARGRRAARLGRRTEAVRERRACRPSEHHPRAGERDRARPDRAPSTGSSSRSSAASPTRSSSRCSRCCGASTAPTSTRKKLLRTLPTEGDARRHGPGRERGRRRRRRRSGGRVQGRVPQPPERRRALPGRRDGRRRDPARHLRDRRAPDRGARLAAIRRAVQPARRAICSTARSPASATTATRSACRRSAARSTSRVPTSRTASSTRWRSVWPTSERMIRSAAAGVGNVVVLFGASTGRDGIGGASVLASAELGDRRGQAPDRPGRRPVRGARSCWSARWSCSSWACSSPCRTSAPRA